MANEINYGLLIKPYVSNSFIKKIINVGLYNVDFIGYNTPISGVSVSDKILNFISNLKNDIITETIDSISKSKVSNQLDVCYEIFKIKTDSSSKLLTYESAVENYFKNREQYVISLLKDVKANPITNMGEFRLHMDDLLKNIQLYNETQVLKKFFNGMNNVFESLSDEKNINQLSFIQDCKEIITDANNSVNKIKSIDKDESKVTSLEFFDDDSYMCATNFMLDHIKKGFRLYKTGFSYLDDNLGGVESAKVLMLSAPSNNGKSLMGVNLLKRIIKHNQEIIKPTDVFLFITLEDHLFNLMRRIISIFGSNSSKLVRNISEKASGIYQDDKFDDDYKNKIDYETKFFINETLKNSIKSVTKNNCRVRIISASENSYSMANVEEIYNDYKSKGLNVRGIVIDYLDVMSSSDPAGKGKSTYDVQGDITHQMRLFAKNENVFIVTMTQNNRSSEDREKSLNVTMLGDSILKLRYTDTLVMMRQMPDKQINDPRVAKDVQLLDNKNTGFNNVEYPDLIPIELKIEKVKDGTKPTKEKYTLFSTETLEIFDNIYEYNEMKKLLPINNNKLKNFGDLLDFTPSEQMRIRDDDELAFVEDIF